MFRRILLLCLVLMLVGGGSVYGQTSTSKTVKLKPPKKAKAPKVKKPPKPSKPPAAKLTAGEKAARKAFKKQNEQTGKQLKSQQKAYTKQLRTAKKQARKTK